MSVPPYVAYDVKCQLLNVQAVLTLSANSIDRLMEIDDHDTATQIGKAGRAIDVCIILLDQTINMLDGAAAEATLELRARTPA